MAVSQRTKTTFALISGAIVFIAIIAVLIAAIFFPAKSDSPTSEPGKKPGSNSQVEDGDDNPEEPVANKPGKAWDKPKFDDEGLVEMVVTDDPREAAVAAARVLWSVDGRKARFYEDYVDEALNRIMHPSPDYVGAEGVARTSIDMSKSHLGHTEFVAGDLEDAVAVWVKDAGWDPEGNKQWWMLGDQTRFDPVAFNGITVTSTPIEAYDEAEMRAYAPDMRMGEDLTYLEADKLPGTYYRYWVRVETATDSHGEGGGGVHLRRNYANLMMYCDAPEDGGICGVATFRTEAPEKWRYRLQ